MILRLFPAFPAVIAVAALPTHADEIRIDSVGVKLIEESLVPAREAGVLNDIKVHEGQWVTAGALLAQIDDSDAQLALHHAQIEHENARELAGNRLQVKSAQAVLKLSQLDLDRARQSDDRYPQSVSQSEMDRLGLVVERAKIDVKQAEKEMEIAQRSLKAAENQLRVAERDIERHRIAAPIEGMVVAVNGHKGEWVQPGDAVVRIVRTSRLRVEAFVHIHELPSISCGRAVTVRIDDSQRGSSEYCGAITFVSPEANPVNGQVRVWAEIDNRQGRLRPGMSGSMVIHENATQSSPAEESPHHGGRQKQSSQKSQ